MYKTIFIKNAKTIFTTIEPSHSIPQVQLLGNAGACFKSYHDAIVITNTWYILVLFHSKCQMNFFSRAFFLFYYELSTINVEKAYLDLLTNHKLANFYLASCITVLTKL